MVEVLVRDLKILVGKLLGAPTRKQVETLRDMASRIHRAANHLEADLNFGRYGEKGYERNR